MERFLIDLLKLIFALKFLRAFLLESYNSFQHYTTICVQFSNSVFLFVLQQRNLRSG